jgi:hypothetical protein
VLKFCVSLFPSGSCEQRHVSKLETGDRSLYKRSEEEVATCKAVQRVGDMWLLVTPVPRLWLVVKRSLRFLVAGPALVKPFASKLRAFWLGIFNGRHCDLQGESLLVDGMGLGYNGYQPVFLWSKPVCKLASF